MLEGLHPRSPTHALRLALPEKAARRVADLVVETFDPAEAASAAFENEATGLWEVEVYFAEEPNRDSIANSSASRRAMRRPRPPNSTRWRKRTG